MSGWSIVYLYNEVFISRKNIVFLSMKVDFVYASSAEPDEMPHNWHFSLDQVLTKILTSQNPMKAAILNISLTL